MLWRYFGFANQALAAIMLWPQPPTCCTGASSLDCLRARLLHDAVSAVYICFEKSMGFGMSYEMSNIVGIAIALVCFALLLTVGRKIQPSDDLSA